MERFSHDSETFVNFSYTIESINGDGLKERRQFFIPDSHDPVALADLNLDKNGFASKIIHDDEKAKADVIDFLQQGRNSSS